MREGLLLYQAGLHRSRIASHLLKYELFSHLQCDSIWVLNLQYSQRGVGGFKNGHQEDFVAASSAAVLFSRNVCESGKRQKTEVSDGWTSSVASSVCCLQLQLPLEDGIHPLDLLISEQVQCLTQHAIIHLGCVCCSDLPWCSCRLPSSTHRGSTLWQPWSGTYYRSCWNDGF